MKIAVVTGASSGLGREMVLQLWDHFGGIDEIWAIARRKERLEELKELTGVTIRPLALDLMKNEAIEELKKLLENQNPRVKFLVNAAGFGKLGQADSLSLEDETGMVRLNCEALTAVTRLVLPYMETNSRIIQFASGAAFLPQPGFAVYAASKAYVLSYSRALNQELKKRRICVTAVCPGPVKTEFFDVLNAGAGEKACDLPFYKQLIMADPKRVARKAMRDSIMCRPLSVYGLPMKAFNLLCKIVPHSFILKLTADLQGDDGICR